MIKQININYHSNNIFIIVSIFFAAVFWVLESYKHYADLHELSFWEELFVPNTHELWMRSLIVFLFLAYGFLTHKLFNKFKRAEEDTKFAYRELEQIFQTAADGMRLVDKDFNTIRVNKTFLNMAGLNEDEAVGMKCYEIFHGSKCHTADCPLTLIINGQKRVEYETEKERKDGSKTTCIVTASPFLDADNQLIGIVEDFKDISERKQAEKEKARLLMDLQHSQKMEAIGTLAGGIAHDFNNILNAILGFGNLARKELPEGSKVAQDLTQVINAGNRAKELVRQILTFSRKGDCQLNPLAPYLIIRESLKLLRASLPSTIEIREYVDIDCGVILADPTKIQQVIVNLCTNALHAMEDKGGILTIKLAQRDLTEKDIEGEPEATPGQFIELIVNDTGQGIDKTTLDRIFEPYFTTKEVGKGTGMGLAVVHGIVKEYGGLIKVESELNKGTTFRIYFPVVEGKMVGAEENNSEPLPKNMGTEHILAIDDEEIIVALYKATLEDLGYKVTGKTSSIEALEEFRANSEKYDLVITDQTMPHMTGSLLAKEIFQLKPDIPLILCTGYSSAVTEETAKEAGIKMFAVKPVADNELALMVRQALDNS